MSAIQQLLTEHLDIWTAADTGPRSGRGRSSGNAGSVYGVKKLRELILELAVRGKLVPQDAGDEPASELLKRIQAEKAKLIAEGKIKKDKALPPITDKENPIDLPDGWTCARLADLVNVLNGRAYKKEELLDSGTPVLRVGNLFTSDHWYYSDLSLEDDKYCNNGDLLFAWSASFGPFIWDGVKSIYHYHIWKLDLYGVDILYKRYLYTFLLEQTQKIKASGHGVMMIHMTKEKMEKLVVYLPPLAEQHRIVAKVDELMALCDQLEAGHNNASAAHEQLASQLLAALTQAPDAEAFSENWQRIATHFDTIFTTEASINTLKQTLLQLAVMGKLVPQDPNDEPASELLKRIRAEKAKLISDGKSRKDKPLAAITNDEKPFELPAGWEWVRMIDCAKQITDGEHLTPPRISDSSKVPLVTAKNVRDGAMDYEITDYVDFDVAKKCWNRCKPELNDILIVSVGATIGRLTVVEDHRDMVIVRSVTLIKPLLVHIPYLALSLRSPLLQKSIWAGVKQNAQPCLYLSVSNSLPIPIPPLTEQHRIVAKVDELMALCNQLKSRLGEASQLQQKLADVLVENAVQNDHGE